MTTEKKHEFMFKIIYEILIFNEKNGEILFLSNKEKFNLKPA